MPSLESYTGLSKLITTAVTCLICMLVSYLHLLLFFSLFSVNGCVAGQACQRARLHLPRIQSLIKGLSHAFPADLYFRCGFSVFALFSILQVNSTVISGLRDRWNEWPPPPKDQIFRPWGNLRRKITDNSDQQPNATSTCNFLYKHPDFCLILLFNYQLPAMGRHLELWTSVASRGSWTYRCNISQPVRVHAIFDTPCSKRPIWYAPQGGRLTQVLLYFKCLWAM